MLATIPLIKLVEELGSLSTKIFHINFCQSLMFSLKFVFRDYIIIGVIYRPPSQNTLEFVEKVNEIISGVTKVNKHCYITGDFNLDLLKNESQFIESLFAFRFLPMITKPTFRDAYRQHLYEQFNCILKKWFDHKRYLGYHLPIFSIVFGDHLRKDSNSFTFRDTSEKRVNEFRHKLENTNWDFSDQANNANDPNTAYNIFIDEHTGLFDACFLFKTIKGKAFNSFRKPWLTKSLLRSINKKNKLYTQYPPYQSNEKLLK